MTNKISEIYNKTKNLFDSEEVKEIIKKEGLLDYQEEVLDAWERIGEEEDEREFLKELSISLLYMVEHVEIEVPEVFGELNKIEAKAYKTLILLGLEAEAKAVIIAIEGRNTRAYELGY